MTGFVDCDQHLYEPRTMWREHIDAPSRDVALQIVDDELGYAWLVWRGQRIALADVQRPGDTRGLGEHRNRRRAGLRADYSYDDALPDDYWNPAARVARLDAMRLRAAVLFPNFGLLWERSLSGTLPALLANMAAWNRWCAAVAGDGAGRLYPVAHLSLRDPDWLTGQLRALADAGVRIAMIAAAPVDGRPLSHPDHERLWAAFVEHGVTPTFHVAFQPPAFADGWSTPSPDVIAPPLDSVMLSTPPALAVTDLIVNGVLERHPDLRIGVVELGATWVPLYLLMLDGGWDFTRRINGRAPADLDGRPSDYFRRQVRVAAFSYESPEQLTTAAGEVFMACSDYPHAEGTDRPTPDYASHGLAPATSPALFSGNVNGLLRAGEAAPGPAVPR